jgi:hypothetical protein
MKRLDDELKEALLRQEAPHGFADQVLTRAAQQGPRLFKPVWRDSWWRVFAQPLIRWAAASAVLAALVMGGAHYRSVQRERVAGEAAKERLVLALRIAGSKLRLAKTKVGEINSEQTQIQQEKE